MLISNNLTESAVLCYFIRIYKTIATQQRQANVKQNNAVFHHNLCNRNTLDKIGIMLPGITWIFAEKLTLTKLLNIFLKRLICKYQNKVTYLPLFKQINKEKKELQFVNVFLFSWDINYFQRLVSRYSIRLKIKIRKNHQTSIFYLYTSVRTKRTHKWF